jgi:hypothetical protein
MKPLLALKKFWFHAVPTAWNEVRILIPGQIQKKFKDMNH